MATIVNDSQKYFRILKSAFDLSPGYIFIVDPQTMQFIDANQTALTNLGYTKNEFLELTPGNIDVNYSNEVMAIVFQSIINSSQQEGVIPTIHRRKDNTTFEVDVHVKTFKEKNKILVLINGTKRNSVGVTQQGTYQVDENTAKKKEADEQLKISEEKYRTLFDDNPLPMFMLEHPSRNFVDVNKAFIDKFGYSRKELEKMTIKDLRRPQDLQESNNVEFDPGKKNEIRTRTYYRRKDNTDLFFDSHAIEIDFKGRKVYLGSTNDITEQVKAEEELQLMNRQLRDFASHLQKVREEERTSMAREIHDELGQQLTGLKMDISWLSKKITTGEEKVKHKIDDALNLIDVTINTVRKIAAELRPSLLDDLGLAETIDWHIREFSNRTAIPVYFDSNAHHKIFSSETSINIYRIFQESLTNIARHANAKKIHCILKTMNGKLIFEITDDGVGFDVNRETGRRTLGLLGIRERVNLMNGNYHLISTLGKGTTLSVEVSL